MGSELVVNSSSPGGDPLHVGRASPDSLSGEQVVEELHFILEQSTLGRFKHSPTSRSRTKTICKFSKCSEKNCPNNDIVEVDQAVDPVESSEDKVHETLERHGGIAELKGHDPQLKRPAVVQKAVLFVYSSDTSTCQ